MLTIVLLISVVPLACSELLLQGNDGDALVLVPHGEDPQYSKNRVIIPQAKNGRQPPLPCVVTESGTHEHGQTFTKGNFHYMCQNGTAEVIACVSDDMSVIQIGRTFLKDGVRHRCNVKGETVTYEQKSTCFDEHSFTHYDIGETFRNGSFKLICKENGIAIAGCFVQNRTDEFIILGQSRVIDNHKHSCDVEDGKIRYTVNLIGCHRGDEIFVEGQIWTDKHIRYQCTDSGNPKVLGCTDDSGLFIDLGRDILMEGIVHRCYRINSTTFYHRFHCNSPPLSECIQAAPIPRRVRSISVDTPHAVV